jgi:hypothetical protein
VHAGGMMQCCAVGNDCDVGDFIIDHCMRKERGVPSDVLNSHGLVAVRYGLLSGDLRPMCRNCFFIESRLVTTEFLKNRLKKHLSERIDPDTDVDALDLTRVYAYDEMAISFTNRCDLSCVYCVQSTQAKTNKYFRMDFPTKYIASTLDFMAAQGIRQLRSCVEGEPTLHPDWCTIFSNFLDKYPNITSRMTTNLARKYTDSEIDLMVRYHTLDVSCDTLDPKLYSKLRRGGRLEQVLENIRRVQVRALELGVKGPAICLHAVVCDLTWSGLRELADYAFANGMIPNLGTYEERANALAFQKSICKPISALPPDERSKACRIISEIALELQRHGLVAVDGPNEVVQGGLLQDVEAKDRRQYNRFSPYNDNPLHNAFYKQFPHGAEDMRLDIAYDYDNIAYNGVLFDRPGRELRLDRFNSHQVVLREVSCFEAGRASYKYSQTVLPGYRKVVDVMDGMFTYRPTFANGVERMLLEVCEWC